MEREKSENSYAIVHFAPQFFSFFFRNCFHPQSSCVHADADFRMSTYGTFPPFFNYVFNSSSFITPFLFCSSFALAPNYCNSAMALVDLRYTPSSPLPPLYSSLLLSLLFAPLPPLTHCSPTHPRTHSPTHPLTHSSHLLTYSSLTSALLFSLLSTPLPSLCSSLLPPLFPFQSVIKYDHHVSHFSTHYTYIT